LSIKTEEVTLVNHLCKLRSGRRRANGRTEDKGET
jgi:hypothetical protein